MISGWTILTVRARENADYEHSEYDGQDQWDATADIVATMKEDSRVHRVTTWKSYVYAYLNCSRYNFEFAEEVMADYGHMIQDAVVLGANDTTDTGCARYYSRPDLGQWDSQYEESQKQDGYYVGEIALAVMTVNHGILARDPFHNNCGLLDDRYEESGTVREKAFGAETEEE